MKTKTSADERQRWRVSIARGAKCMNVQHALDLMDDLDMAQDLAKRAIALSEELLPYVPEYFRTKWKHDDELAELQKLRDEK